MNAHKKEGFFDNLKNDIPAGFVVFLVALPLCLGIALASGTSPLSGLIAGIVGGTVVALASGSPLGVSGPAAGLAVIVFDSLIELNQAYEIFLLAVVFAGLLQLAMGYLKLGVIGYYFPNSVVKGMLSGIGITIILKQIPHAFGYDEDPEGDLGFFQMDGENTFSELINMLNFIKPGAIVIAVVSLAILILWEQAFMKRQSFAKVIQGPLIAVLAGVGLNVAFQGTELFALGTKQLVDIPISGSIEGFFGQFTLPDFSAWNNPLVYKIGGIIALVASLETLLCVEATDKLDPQKRITPTNRELKAQGLGNFISGLIGGLPITQVIVRSSANIQSGGKTKASAFFHGILLLVSVATIPFVLNMIPKASLAAVLFVVGYKLAKPSLIKGMYNRGFSQFFPFAATILGIVFTNLLVGIGIGLAVAIVQILWNNYQTPYHFDPDEHKEGDPVNIDLAEHVTFLNKVGMLHTFEQLPDGTHVIINTGKNKTIHPDVIEIIDEFKINAPTRDITIEIVGKLENTKQKNAVNQLGKKVGSSS